MKSTDNELKYQAALRYYADKKYFQALQLLEELVVVFRATPRGEEVYYYYAKAYFGTGDYLTAAYHFNNFYKTFPGSRYAEECLFMNAYCYYLDSPVYSLDQKSTLEAIQQLQFFINKFPQSSRIEECNRLIDQLRFKLETKAYQNARLFYRTEDYRAATIAFTNMIKDFPTTIYAEECMFMAFKSAYYYASNSIITKRRERYYDALEHYFNLVEKFPDGKFQKEADRIFEDVKKQLQMLDEHKNVTLGRQ